MQAQSKIPQLLEINGIEYEVDAEGFLQNQSDWTREVASGMAAKDGVDLEAAHWEVIGFLRDYYFKYQIAPAIRVLTREIGKRLGPDKGNSRYLNQLFPFGPAKQPAVTRGYRNRRAVFELVEIAFD